MRRFRPPPLPSSPIGGGGGGANDAGIFRGGDWNTTGQVKNIDRGAKKMEWWQWLMCQDELVLEPSAVGTIAERAPLA